MDWLFAIAIFISGFLLGLGLMYFLKKQQIKSQDEMTDRILAESEANKKEEINEIIGNIKDSFGNLSLEALSKASEGLVKLANQRLETEREFNSQELDKKKGLIDNQLNQMTTELAKVSNLMNELEKDRENKFGELSNHLKAATEQTSKLNQTTNSLREALSGTKARGQWGERMAEDVLRSAGFIEGVNYVKQKKIVEVGNKPDFTFFLPNDLTLNMDVKFPLDNYLNFINSDSKIEKDQYCRSFIRNVKESIKGVTSRDYINPQQNTVDYILLFIPNDQIYAFIQEIDKTIIDESLDKKVVLCSPMSLFAILSIIRQAVDNFTMEMTSNEILLLMDSFKKQWNMFVKKMEAVGKSINSAQKEFEILTTTRQRQLEKPLREIENLKNQKGLVSNEENGNIGSTPRELLFNTEEDDF